MGRIVVLPEELEIIEKRLANIEKAIVDNSKSKQVNDQILDTEDVMTLLKVSRRSLQNWRDMGLIEFSAINGKFYYRISAIDKMLNQHLKN